MVHRTLLLAAALPVLGMTQTEHGIVHRTAAITHQKAVAKATAGKGGTARAKAVNISNTIVRVRPRVVVTPARRIVVTPMRTVIIRRRVVVREADDPVTVASAPAVTTAQQALPATGATAVGTAAGTAAVAGALWYYVRSKRLLRQAGRLVGKGAG